MLVIYACLFMDGNIFQKMYASMFIIATIIFVTVLLGSIMGALYNVHFIEFTGTVSAGYFHTDNNMGCCGNACKNIKKIQLWSEY